MAMTWQRPLGVKLLGRVNTADLQHAAHMEQMTWVKINYGYKQHTLPH
jgi:hypothetical protein